MISTEDLAGEISDLGKAIGLIQDDGSLDGGWFSDPLGALESILSNHSQREALLRMIDALLPPIAVAGAPADEEWHPLLGDQPRGNVYLTVKDTGSGIVLALSGDLGTTGGGIGARLSAQLPLVSAGATVTPLAGTPSGPLLVRLRVRLGWKRADGESIDLEAISLAASIASSGPGLVIVLEQLSLAGSPPRDRILDPDHLGSEAFDLVLGLLKQALHNLVPAPGTEAGSVVDHLLKLLGLGGDGIPQFPFADVTRNPAALRNWLQQLVTPHSDPPVMAWLEHLAGLAGAPAPTTSGSGTDGDPWRVEVFSFSEPSGLAIVAAQVNDTLRLGVEAALVTGGADASLAARTYLAGIPLNGTASATVLPSASIALRAPAGAGPLTSGGPISVGSLRAGLNWNGTRLQPLLELDDVTFAGATYARLDLTNTDSVGQAATAIVKKAITDALGTGVGLHLASLAGLIPPTGDPGSPHTVDLATLVANPARAIGAFHREVLLDGARWSSLFAEITGLIGIAGSVSGAGTQSDPWRVDLGLAGSINLQLAAWNAQTSSASTDPQLLRLGLRAAADSAPMHFEWLAELLAFDLPQGAAGSVSLMAGQHVSFRVQPGPNVTLFSTGTLHADSLDADMDWTPRSSISWHAGVNNLSLAFGGTTVTVAALRFPPPGGFDVSNAAATAAALGVAVGDLEALLRILLARAALSWGGMPGFVLAGLLGVHGTLNGFPSDWPTLGDPGAPGSLLSDPFTALRNWLGHLATDLSADGAAFLPRALAWLRALLANSLPASPTAALPHPNIAGSGSYEDPWALALLQGAQATDALVWLEPQGPPSNWATLLGAQASSAPDFLTLAGLVGQLGGFLSPLADVTAGADPAALARSLVQLADHLAASDGVVPSVSQIPTGSTWTAGAPITVPHHLQPKDPSAITQILAQIDSWAGGAGGTRAVLLLGPAFSDHAIWQDLLADPNRHGTTDPNANFNLRMPGVDPPAVSLAGVTAVTDHYTADLNDNGTGDLPSLVAQIGRVVARIGELRPAVQVTLVAHSTAGVAARAFTATNPTLVSGLITLGTPHSGAPLPFLTDDTIATAVRFVQLLIPDAMASSSLRDTLPHLVTALDGYLPPASPGALAVPAPYPAGSFAGTATTDTGGRPALALGGTLPGSLFELLKQACSARAGEAVGAARPAPTHISFGARARLGLPAAKPGDVQADAFLRASMFRVRLRDGVAEPARPAQALGVRVELERPGGWLVGAASSFGGPGSTLVDVRVRSAEFGVDIEPSGVQPLLALHQVSYRGPMKPHADIADSAAQALLGAVMEAISVPPPVANSPAAVVLFVLQKLNVAVPDPRPNGGVGISADAFNAILADAASYFGPRLVPALNEVATAPPGLAGLVGPPGGPWVMQIAGLPLQVYLESGPLRLGLRTSGLPLASNATLRFDASVTLPGLAPALDAAFQIGAFTLSYSQTTGRLTASAEPWLAPLDLVPTPSSAALTAVLNDALPRLLFSAAAGAILEGLLGPGVQIGPLDTLFSATGDFLHRPSSLGKGDGSGGLDVAKLTTLLQAINRLAGFPVGPGLSLPGGLQLTASGDPAQFQLGTTAAIGGVLGVALTATIDHLHHVTPGGTLSLTTPLTGNWPAVTITFGVDPPDVSLVVAPEGVTPIQILPTFSGLGVLRGAAEALLPAALDALVDKVSTPGPAPQWLTLSLSMAEALGIYDNVGKFAAHANDLHALLTADFLNLFDPSKRHQVAVAGAALLNGLGLPGSASAPGLSPAVTWTFPLTGADTGTVTIMAGWDGSGPVAVLSLAGPSAGSGLKLAGGAIETALTVGYSGGAIQCTAGLGLHLNNALGIDVAPKLSVGFSSAGGTNRFRLDFLPLATAGSDGPLTITLAPAPQVTSATGTPEQLIETWVIPITAKAVFEAVRPQLATPLWPGGPFQVRDVLAFAHIVDKGATPVQDQLHSPFPDLLTMVSGLVAGLAGATGLSVNVGTLTVGLASSGSRVGIKLGGHQDFTAGSYAISMRFGAPQSWTTSAAGDNGSPGASDGLVLNLFQASGGGSFSFNPGLSVRGLGLGLSGAGDTPLVDLSQFRLGGFQGYVFFNAEFMGGLSFNSFGGGVELASLGLPLGLATGGNVGGDNPVAASLMRSDGGSSGGDQHPVNPGVDVDAWYWDHPSGDGNFHIRFGGQTGTLWISVHSGFGPVYINQIGLQVSNTDAALLIDGSVKVDGLTAQCDELSVTIPYKFLLSPDHWSLDLKGLAVGFTSPGVTIACGLLKSPGPPVEYDGLLLIQISQFGFIAVGAYSTPNIPGSTDTFTSLFVFAGVFIVIGIPPIIEIDAFGLGVGYNRELVVPDDLNQIPSFILLEALDDPGKIANDPMGALTSIRSQVPAKRGSFWLAVGLRGTTFEIVHVTAVLYVALDGGLEIGILGVARMALPSDSTALVSIELALKVRFSTAEGLFSIQAQLTDNSWLLSPDCQLTGGYAYFVWFRESQFLLTMGGYHPAFHPRPEFPQVPRLGYHWDFLGVVHLKGESYFALTNTCVMAGTRMEATYGPDWLCVWFTAYTDFLLSWDPFFYDIRVGIAVGARFRIEICFFGCVTIDVSVSLGADLEIAGPPLHGTVTVDLAVASVTVSFGPEPQPVKDPLPWDTFRNKYLGAGDPDHTAVAGHILTGLLVSEPPGAQPSPGTEAQPWRLGAEWSFQTETRMPANEFTFQEEVDRSEASLHSLPFGHYGPLSTVYDFDIAPMFVEHPQRTSKHVVNIFGRSPDGTSWIHMAPPDSFEVVPDDRYRIANTANFLVDTVISQVSEAVYHLLDHDNVPAAANTLPVLTGLKIQGVALLQGESAAIPIGTLFDYGFSRPLPFATLTVSIINDLKALGAAADVLAALPAQVSTPEMLGAAKSMLSGGGFFSDARVGAGLPASGLSAVAARALERYRSAPPLIAPITTGLTMNPPAQPLPPTVLEVPKVSPVPLEAPRLRAVLQGRPLPAFDAPPAMRTTVAAAKGAPRMAAPKFQTLPGARLDFVAAGSGARPTMLARSGRTLRSPELGFAAGRTHIDAFRKAEQAVSATIGVTVPAGTIHIWDLPGGAGQSVSVTGEAARLTFLTRAGRPISDLEVAGGATVPAPKGAGMVAVTSLGSPSKTAFGTRQASAAVGLGSLSFALAPGGRAPITGWQTGNLVAQVSATAFLPRGACLIVPHAFTTHKRGHKTAQGMVRLSDAMVDQPGVETWLPLATAVIGLLLDVQDPCDSADGDLAIAVTGASLATPPVRVAGGRRKLLLYDVVNRQADDHIGVSVASRNGLRLAGIIGLTGTAKEWGVRMNGGVPEHLVPEMHFTPDGQVTLRIQNVVPTDNTGARV